MPRARINGCMMYYEVQGEGQAIIFVHPPVLSSKCFIYQAENLKNDYKTILFDIRGHGKSDSSGQPLTYSVIAEDIKQLLDYLKIERVYLCGYSTGGSIVLQFLLTYPEYASGAVLVGGISEVHDWRLKFRISIGIALAKAKITQTLAFALSVAHSNSLRLFWGTLKDALRSNAQNVEQYYKSSRDFNCTSQLSQIHCPVALVYGEKDKPFHAYGSLLKDSLQRSGIVYMPGANHRIPIFFSKELNTIISRFLHQFASNSSD